jgi:hypothetical protein
MTDYITRAFQVKILKLRRIENLMCVSVSTASFQLVLEACTVYGRSGSITKKETAIPDHLHLVGWEKNRI